MTTDIGRAAGQGTLALGSASHRSLSPPEPGQVRSAQAALFRRFLADVDHRTTGEILAHPGFAQMRRHFITDTMGCYETARFPGGCQSTAYRVAAVGVIICLYAAYDDAFRGTWPTVARLKQTIITFGLSSARQVDDFVARLVRTDHVVLERSEADGRLRLLKPTDKLLAWDSGVLVPYYDALHALYPEPGYDAIRDPGFHLAQRRTAVRYFASLAGFMQENTDLLPFHNMYQGVHILMAMANLGAAEDASPVHEPDLGVLQEKFGISRSHIRNTLLAAQQAGLLTWNGRGRKVLALTPRGLTAIDRFIADTLSAHDLGYRLALADLGHPAAAPKRRTN